MSRADFDGTVEAFKQALAQFVKGDPQPIIEVCSRRDDVTLANPLGPPHRGPVAVDKAITEAAALLRGGSIRGFEEISRYSTPDLGYLLHIERTQAQLRGSETVVPIALRVTLIFRREGEAWQLVHRHADPITTERSVDTAIET